MTGLAMICKMYGQMIVTDENGKKVIWVWDYANDKPRLKYEMTKEELAKEQEKSAKQELDLKKLIAENASLKEELSARRQEQQQTYVPKSLDLSEYKTRKLYIDSMLTDAGWTEGKDWINEVELPGMPNKSEVGYADYVL